eukprot:2287840-Pleurochrysis_carterae.AAC.1
MFALVLCKARGARASTAAARGGLRIDPVKLRQCWVGHESGRVRPRKRRHAFLWRTLELACYALVRG